MLLVVVALAIIGGAAQRSQLFSMTPAGATAGSLDTMYKPPISGG